MKEQAGLSSCFLGSSEYLTHCILCSYFLSSRKKKKDPIIPLSVRYREGKYMCTPPFLSSSLLSVLLCYCF